MAQQVVEGSNERIWSGNTRDMGAIRDAYKKDPEQYLIPYASALYSFLHKNKKYRYELISLRVHLEARAQSLLETKLGKLTTDEIADAADCLSTYLEWMSRQPKVGGEDQQSLRELAKKVAGFGERFASPSHHCWSLLMLTFCRLELYDKPAKSVWPKLYQVALKAHRIEDPKQCARVYRKLGLLFRKAGLRRSGFGWGVRAIFMPGLPLDHRLKSIAALLGIDP